MSTFYNINTTAMGINYKGGTHINNIILNALEIKDEKLILEAQIFDKDTNTLNIFLSTAKTTQLCPHCYKYTNRFHSYRNKVLIHTIFTTKKCKIILRQRRYKCLNCNTTFLEVNNISLGYNKLSDITKDLILKELKTTSSYIDISKRCNVSSQTVLNYMDKYINCKRRKLPEVLCIDEFKNLSHGKGKYACLLLNYETGEIVDILENRTLDYLQYYFNRIPKNELKNVQYVVSDMYEGYKHLATTTFPNATLVIDAFHYIRYISDALNRIRRRVQNCYNKNSNEYKVLKKHWKLLTMNGNKLNDKIRSWSYINVEMSSEDVVKLIRKIHPDINYAYLKKEDFFYSYKKISYDKAEGFLLHFISSLKESNIEELIEIANTFNNWLPYIVNSFNKNEYGKRMSNGIIEGTNNKIKVIKRVSYGYSDFYHLRNRIMYIFNDNENPLDIPLDLSEIKKIKTPFYKKRKPYVKGFLKSNNKFSNAYSIRHLDQVNNPLMNNKEAIEYLNNLHITKTELKQLNKWIKDGNTFYSNPFDLCDDNGNPSNYIESVRFIKKFKK